MTTSVLSRQDGDLTAGHADGASGNRGLEAPGAGRRLRAIVENQPACLMEVTDEGHVRALNTACLTLVGADNLRQVLGTSYLGLVVAADRERVGDFIRRVSAGARGSIEYGIARMSGGVKTVISDAAPLDRGDGGGVATLFVTRDLTDQKAREKRAFECHAQERERLQAEIEAAGDRERTTTLQRDDERLRVAQALTRARTQLLELRSERDDLLRAKGRVGASRRPLQVA